MAENHISGIPVVEKDGKLVGIVTNRDVRFAANPDQPVAELMTAHSPSSISRRNLSSVLMASPLLLCLLPEFRETGVFDKSSINAEFIHGAAV